jgi:hypothetical protein
VTLASLENIRRSERVLMFVPTTSTLWVVLSRYSVTLWTIFFVSIGIPMCIESTIVASHSHDADVPIDQTPQASHALRTMRNIGSGDRLTMQFLEDIHLGSQNLAPQKLLERK